MQGVVGQTQDNQLKKQENQRTAHGQSSGSNDLLLLLLSNQEVHTSRHHFGR